MDFNNDSGTLSNVSVISPTTNSLTLANTGALVLSTGNTSQRPTFENGLIRYNSESGYVEAASGSEWVNITNAGNNVAQIYADTLEPTGYVNQSDSEMFFDDSTRTFTIQPKAPATSFSYYIFGEKYTITSAKTIQIADVEGTSYIYFANDSQLHVITTFSSDILLRSNAYTSAIYWDATNQKALLFAEERHGMIMDGVTHSYLHSSFGTQYTSGLGLINLSLDGTGDSNANAQLGVSNGSIRDEDILFSITDGQWQDISPIAHIPVYFRLGSGNGVWRVKPADDYPLVYTGSVAGYSGTRCAFNENTGSAWQLTEVGNSDTFLVHIYATSNFRSPIIAVLGQSHYSSVIQASDAALTEIRQLTLAGLPFTEFTPIGSLVIESSTSYSNVPKARFRSLSDGGSYIDWRGATARSLQALSLVTSASSITLTGDVTGSGLTGSNTSVTLNTVNSNVGQFGDAISIPQITVNAKGLVTSVSNIAISGSSGSISVTGSDITMSGNTGTAITNATLATVNSNVGQFGSVTQIPVITVNAKGLVTAVSNASVALPSDSISVTGSDFTMSGTTGTAITNGTLATVNGNVGQFGSSTTVSQVTVNAKGLVTAVSDVAIANSLTFTGNVTGNGTVGSSTALTLETKGTAGTYKSVTTDAYGRVTAGTNPTTLSGYGITDAAPISSSYITVAPNDGTLTNERILAGTANQIVLTDGGANGSATLSLAANVVLPGIGTVTVPVGTTTARPASPTAGMFRFNTTLGALEYYTGAIWATVGSSSATGTVTSVSVVSANGLSGSVANPATTPAITLSTSVTGMLKGNGSAISAGISGTDYSAGTAALATGLLKSTTSTGALSIAVDGVDYVTPVAGGGVGLRQVSVVVAPTSGTTSKADSNVSPVITDGVQIWSQSMSPKSASSSFTIDGSFYIDHNTNNRRIVVAIWRTVGAVNTLVGVSSAFITASNNGGEIAISFFDQPATASLVTYTLRVWANGAGTWYVGQGSTALFNGNLGKQIVRLTETA